MAIPGNKPPKSIGSCEVNQLDGSWETRTLIRSGIYYYLTFPDGSGRMRLEFPSEKEVQGFFNGEEVEAHLSQNPRTTRVRNYHPPPTRKKKRCNR
jgi:hypothetical protein